MIKIKSPLTNSDNTKIISKINSDYIVNMYRESYSIDVARFFSDIPEVQIVECLDTGYKFFHPFNISGDGLFYENLQKYEWYYMPWKWEHQETAKKIQPGMKVLEVGCAEGDFIEKITKEFGGLCTGLELNEHAAKKASSKGLNVEVKSIQNFSDENEGLFDIVCSFQVLEHVDSVKEFIESMVKCLKNGGKLIIGVPNNDSFLGLSDNLLNIPPHHMGLWNKQSLASLTNIFPIELVQFHFESLQEYHVDYYKKTVKDCSIKKMDQNIDKFGFLGRILNQYEKIFFEKNLKIKYPNLDNFTVLVEFTKK